jgi:hypothetical protein
MPAIAAVRSAARNAFLAPETQAATATVAGRNLDVDFVDEHWGG